MLLSWEVAGLVVNMTWIPESKLSKFHIAVIRRFIAILELFALLLARRVDLFRFWREWHPGV